MTELAKRLEQTKFDLPPGWEPSEGDVLTGDVVDHKQARTRDGFAHIFVIEPDDGPAVSLWFYATTLKYAADQGQRVAIRHEGEHPVSGRDLFRIRRAKDGKNEAT